MRDIRGLDVVSVPPGPHATGLVAARLPDAIDSRVLMDNLRERHGVVVKMSEKRWLNGIRLSPHSSTPRPTSTGPCRRSAPNWGERPTAFRRNGMLL